MEKINLKEIGTLYNKQNEYYEKYKDTLTPEQQDILRKQIDDTESILYKATVSNMLIDGSLASKKNKRVCILLTLSGLIGLWTFIISGLMIQYSTLQYIGMILFLLGPVASIYVGKISKGIIYLCTGGMMGIGYLVDLILLYKNKFKDKYGFYINK